MHGSAGDRDSQVIALRVPPDLLPSPLAGEGRGRGAPRRRALSEGDRRSPPLPNPSPARGEGLEADVSRGVVSPGHVLLPSPLAGEGPGERGAALPRLSEGGPRSPPLPNPSPARGEGLEADVSRGVVSPGHVLSPSPARGEGLEAVASSGVVDLASADRAGQAPCAVGFSSSSRRCRPSRPSASIVARFRCTIASGSGYAVTARSRLSSRSRCRVG